MTNSEYLNLVKQLENAPLEIQRQAKKSLSGSISIGSEREKKAEAKQKKQLANLQERVYKFVKAELQDMKIDAENCVTFNFRVDLGGTKFKHLTEPKKKSRKSYLKTKKAVEMQGKDSAKMKTKKAKGTYEYIK